jgi:hypothetical protein
MCNEGSAIFETPGKVLIGTNSIGISLLFWTIGGLVATCGLLVWLEFGLSIPRQVVSSGVERSVPRSGGEKNYVRKDTILCELDHIDGH